MLDLSTSAVGRTIAQGQSFALNNVELPCRDNHCDAQGFDAMLDVYHISYNDMRQHCQTTGMLGVRFHILGSTTDLTIDKYQMTF